MLWPKHHQREETHTRAVLREITWPFDSREMVRRQTHQTVIESPSRGRRDGPGSRWGEWYLSKVGEAPLPKQSLQVDQCLFFSGMVIRGSGIYRGVTRPKPSYINQIQSTMDKSGFGTLMLA